MASAGFSISESPTLYHNRCIDSTFLVRTQSVLTVSKLAKRREINTGANFVWNKSPATFKYNLCYYTHFWCLF